MKGKSTFCTGPKWLCACRISVAPVSPERVPSSFEEPVDMLLFAVPNVNKKEMDYIFYINRELTTPIVCSGNKNKNSSSNEIYENN